MDKNINTSDLHIYQDDKTGNYYYYNGKELVLLGNRTPKIGDTGDSDFQEKENQERAERIKQEREEAQKAKDEGRQYDPEALRDPETEEERQKRIQDIQNMFSDTEISDEVQRETKAKVDKDLMRQKAAEIANMRGSKVQRFARSLDQYLANELRPQRSSTWNKPNMSYEGSGIIRKGRRREATKHIPSINVYFDQSGSWDDSDIAVGMEAIAVLKNYIDRGEITMDLFYFSNIISDDAAKARENGGTGAGAKLIEHIQATQPDNVIFMTDDDIGTGWNEIYNAPKIKVPGAVWFLFRGKASPALPEWVKGMRQNLAFII